MLAPKIGVKFNRETREWKYRVKFSGKRGVLVKGIASSREEASEMAVDIVRRALLGYAAADVLQKVS